MDEIEATNNYQNLTNPTRFPSKTSGVYSKRNSGGNVEEFIELFESPYEKIGFPNFPIFSLKGDVDSIYGYTETLEELLSSFAHKSQNGLIESMLMLPSTTNPIKKTWSSRFFVDTTALKEKPIQLKSGKAGKISLERFPSIELASMSIGLHRSVSISMINIGTCGIVREPVFNKTEMAVVNACINIARKLAIETCQDEGNSQMEKSFKEFHPAKTCYGEKSKKAATQDINELTKEEMILFAKSFRKALEIISDEEQHEFNITKVEYAGIRSDEKFTPLFSEMVEFARELLCGSIFVASISGIKKYFNKKDYNLGSAVTADVNEIKERYTDILMEHETELVEEANRDLLAFHEKVSIEELPATVIPFRTRDSSIAMTRQFRFLELSDIQQHWEIFKDHFEPDWKKDMEDTFNTKINELCDKLNEFLLHIFKAGDQRCNIFFDIGIEIRLPGCNTLLIDVDKAFPVLQRISKERYGTTKRIEYYVFDSFISHLTRMKFPLTTMIFSSEIIEKFIFDY